VIAVRRFSGSEPTDKSSNLQPYPRKHAEGRCKFQCGHSPLRAFTPQSAPGSDRVRAVQSLGVCVIPEGHINGFEAHETAVTPLAERSNPCPRPGQNIQIGCVEPSAIEPASVRLTLYSWDSALVSVIVEGLPCCFSRPERRMVTTAARSRRNMMSTNTID